MRMIDIRWAQRYQRATGRRSRATQLWAAAGLLLLSGCASSVSVEKVQAGDGAKSCEQLASAIQEAERFRKEAENKKGVTGTNTAAALLFWPGLLVTYSDANAAIKAADQRKEYLTELRVKKGCS